MRKNKTLGAAFAQTAVQTMLEKNYKVHCSLNDQEVPEDLKIKDIVDQVRALTQFQQIHFVSLSLTGRMKLNSVLRIY